MAKAPVDLDDREELGWLDWIARGGIHLAGAIALPMFAFLNFEKSDVIRVVANTPPEGIVKITLLVYYACWHYGAIIDLDLHKKVLIKDPNKGAINPKAILVFVGFIVTAYGLLWASSYESVFAVAIFVFWSVLTAAGKFTRDLALPMFVESGTWYAGHHKFYEVQKQVRVSRYFFGRQMKIRNRVGFGLTLLIVLVTFAGPAREWIASAVHQRIPAANLASVAALVPSFAFALFVAITEGWQWLMRINALNSVKVLNELKREYHLEPYTEDDG